MGKQRTQPIDELQLGPRTVLRQGDRIRVSCGKRHGPTDAALVQRGEFLVQQIFRRGRRVWADCFEVDGPLIGGSHMLYLAGPAYPSSIIPAAKYRPYRVRKVRR